jgi:glycosyltransferase involved in cell wall biosynthesis
VTRILYVITRLAMGGAPHTMLTAIRGLKESGYEITLASGYPAPGEGSLVDEARSLGVELIFVPTLQRELHVLRDVRALWSLWRLMRERQFHVVHTHLSKAGILGRAAAFLSGQPCVHTFHGDVLEGYFSPAKSRVFLTAERMAGRVTHRFVCVSADLRRRLLAYNLGVESHFVTVANGIDPARLAAPGGKSHPDCRVGTLAMFYPVKRLDHFIEMAHRIKLRDPRIQFDMAGDGMVRVQLEEQARQLGHPVRFTGICQEPAAFLAQLDVFVSCSDFESSGMSVMEAMSMGVPVVATSVGGIPEIVTEGETGLLVPAGDLEALTEAVWHLLQDPEKRARMGANAKRFARAHFSTDRMVSDLDALYRELLS